VGSASFAETPPDLFGSEVLPLLGISESEVAQLRASHPYDRDFQRALLDLGKKRFRLAARLLHPDTRLLTARYDESDHFRGWIDGYSKLEKAKHRPYTEEELRAEGLRELVAAGFRKLVLAEAAFENWAQFGAPGTLVLDNDPVLHHAAWEAHTGIKAK